MSTDFSQQLTAQVEHACAQLKSLQNKLIQDDVDLQQVQHSLDELNDSVKSFFSNVQHQLTEADKQVIAHYVSNLQEVIREVESLRDGVGAQLGQLRRGRKVSSAYNQNT